MRGYHWGMIFLFLAVGYLIGMMWPSPGQRLRSAIGV